jgi:hypothetical protein
MTDNTCPICGKGELLPHPVTETFEAGGFVQSHTHTEHRCSNPACGADDQDCIEHLERQQKASA